MTVPTPRTALGQQKEVDQRLLLLERRLARLGGGGTARTKRITDWNLASAPGSYVGVSAANAPTPTGTYVGVTYDSVPESGLQASSTQVVYSLSSPFRVWRRFYNFTAGTGWTAWEQHEAGAGGGSVAWADVTGKPSSFPSTWATVSGKPSTFPSTWATVSGKPSTFPPDGHSHSSSQITDFSSAVDARVNALVPTATTSVAGKVELATNAETQAGTLSSRAVTPASLTARTATESRTGIARLADIWEAQLFPTAIRPSSDLDNTIMTPRRVKDMLEYFAPVAGQGGMSQIVTDWNSVTSVGFYWSQTGQWGAANVPPGATGPLVGFVHNTGTVGYSSGGEGDVVQEVYELGLVSGQNQVVRKWTRAGFDGSWTAWKDMAPNWGDVTGKPSTFPSTWATVSGKPSTFAPSAHTHAWGEVTGKPSTFPSTWATVSGKPTTFAPSAHSHAWGEVTGKPSTFAPSAHTHAAADVTSGTFAAARLPAATETTLGAVERATQMEVDSGTDNTRYVTPYHLASSLRESTPAGVIQMTAASAAPGGYLLCNGAAVSRTTYAALFAAIGTAYGAGNGSSTFNLPNLSGRVPVGRDAGQSEFDTLAETGGAKTHTLTQNEMPSHTHAQNAHGHTATTASAGAHNHRFSYDGADNIPGSANSYYYINDNGGSRTSTDGAHTHAVTVANATATNQNTGGGAAHNNLQPYIVVNYIIKT